MQDLDVYYLILYCDLEWSEVTSFERIVAEQQNADLNVEQVDNYFAGGILVHNTQYELVEKDDNNVQEAQ